MSQTPRDAAARYLRQILVPEIGAEGQARLEDGVVAFEGGSERARAIASDYALRAGLQVDALATGTHRLPTATTPSDDVAPARDLLVGAFAAVEAIKAATGVGRQGRLPIDFLTHENEN